MGNFIKVEVTIPRTLIKRLQYMTEDEHVLGCDGRTRYYIERRGDNYRICLEELKHGKTKTK